MRRLAVVAVLLASVPALQAHEVLHDVVRGRAVAVRATFVDGEVLAYTPSEVFSPSDPKIPWQKGRTDREGWVAFVPDAPGAWRVRVTDDTGHGLDVTVDVGADGAVSTGAGSGSTALVILRPLLGLLAVALVFGGLLVAYRRRGRQA